MCNLRGGGGDLGRGDDGSKEEGHLNACEVRVINYKNLIILYIYTCNVAHHIDYIRMSR